MCCVKSESTRISVILGTLCMKLRRIGEVVSFKFRILNFSITNIHLSVKQYTCNILNS